MHWTFLARSSYYSLGSDNDPVVFISHNVGPGSRVEDSCKAAGGQRNPYTECDLFRAQFVRGIGVEQKGDWGCLR